MKAPLVAAECCVPVTVDADIVSARMRGRALALQLGFSPERATLLAAAISELARNILLYARSGEIAMSVPDHSSRLGIQVVARDTGPGIPDLRLALQDGYSTSGRLGLGLPGVRRLMDRFEIASSGSGGTTVTVIMWLD